MPLVLLALTHAIQAHHAYSVHQESVLVLHTAVVQQHTLAVLVGQLVSH
jgi:hypothetical protein